MIIPEWPPNIGQIAAAFPRARSHGTIFAYGDDIYNPYDVNIPWALMAHESVHQQRQLARGVAEWWTLYCAGPDFRYDEELLAHIAEYMTQCPPGSPRNLRRIVLRKTAQRLAAPLYGYKVSIDKAASDIKAATR